MHGVTAGLLLLLGIFLLQGKCAVSTWLVQGKFGLVQGKFANKVECTVLLQGKCAVSTRLVQPGSARERVRSARSVPSRSGVGSAR